MRYVWSRGRRLRLCLYYLLAKLPSALTGRLLVPAAPFIVKARSAAWANMVIQDPDAVDFAG